MQNPMPVSSLAPTHHLLDLPVEILEEIASFLPSSNAEPTQRSVLALRWTCRTLYHILLPPHFPNVFKIDHDSYTIYNDLLRVEQWPEYAAGSWRFLQVSELPLSSRISLPWASTLAPRSYFACAGCLRLRVRGAFAVSQTSQSRAKGTVLAGLRDTHHASIPDWTWRAWRKQGNVGLRMCITCGIARMWYKPGGTTLAFESEELVREGQDWRVIKELRHGIVCRRCEGFAPCAMNSKEMLRKTCQRCLDYRPPGQGW